MAALRLSENSARLLKRTLGGFSLPEEAAAEIVEVVEFDLQQDRDIKLRWIPNDGFHEYRLSWDHPASNRSFAIIWELEWDRNADLLIALDVNVIEKRPRLARSDET